MQIIPITITRATMARTLTAYEANPELIDQVTALYTHLDRVDAELKARRSVMSSALCVELGINAVMDAALLRDETWLTIIDRMLGIYDKAKGEEQS